MASETPRRASDGAECYKDVPPHAQPALLGDAPDGRSALEALGASAEGPISLVLRPRKARLALLLLGSLGFVSIGLASRQPILLLCATFFGVCAAAFAVMLLPGAAYLSLNRDGFTTCSLFRVRRVPWTDVGPFGPTQVSGKAMVGYDSVAQAARRPRLAAVNTGLSGYNSALPDTYGLRAPDLAALMNEARSRALATEP